MTKEIIELGHLKKALDSLEEVLKQPKNEFMRDATIQRFEYSYELMWKLLKRYLTKNIDVTVYSVKDVFREAAKLNIISDLDKWFAFHEARNLTLHTYSEENSEKTYKVAAEFSVSAKVAFTALEKACADSIE